MEFLCAKWELSVEWVTNGSQLTISDGMAGLHLDYPCGFPFNILQTWAWISLSYCLVQKTDPAMLLTMQHWYELHLSFHLGFLGSFGIQALGGDWSGKSSPVLWPWSHPLVQAVAPGNLRSIHLHVRKLVLARRIFWVSPNLNSLQCKYACETPWVGFESSKEDNSHKWRLPFHFWITLGKPAAWCSVTIGFRDRVKYWLQEPGTCPRSPKPTPQRFLQFIHRHSCGHMIFHKTFSKVNP